jgi:hypothetical protein
MEISIFSKLPFDLIRYILLFNYHFILRKNKIICINSILKNDYRYELLSNIEKKYQIVRNQWTVILNCGIHYKRFVFGYNINTTLWRNYFFYTYKYNPNLKEWSLL